MQYKPSNLNSFFILSLLGLLLFHPAVWAAENQTNLPEDQQPVNISANSLMASEKTGKSVYKGNVIITQGSLTLKGELVDISHPNNQLTTVIATGNPANFKRYSQVDQAWIKGKAQKIEYNAVDKTVLLVGDAMVEQPGEHTIKGPKLFYDMDKQTLQAQSTETEKQRISVTLNPSNREKPEPEPQQALENTEPEKALNQPEQTAPKEQAQ